MDSPWGCWPSPSPRRFTHNPVRSPARKSARQKGIAAENIYVASDRNGSVTVGGGADDLKKLADAGLAEYTDAFVAMGDGQHLGQLDRRRL